MGSTRVRFFLHRRGLGIPFAVGLALGIAAAAAAAPRLVAVGDVHGDLAGFKAILAEAGVLDGAGAWAGGETVLVQVGDLIDRGPRMRGTLDFVMALETAAATRGGRVVSLLGNHEVMNMTGDLRYVVPANYAEFADAGSEARRLEGWRQVRDFRERRARRLGLPAPPSGSEAREAWLEKHPPGFLEHQAAFGPDGAYGRWLRGRSACFVAENTAFLHGGIAPAYAGTSIEEIDQRVREDLSRFDSDKRRFVAEGMILPFDDLGEMTRAVREELQALSAASASAQAAAESEGKTYTPPAADAERRGVYERFLDWAGWTMNAPDGPLWFRGYSEWTDVQGGTEMPLLLTGAGVAHFVVGHSVQKGARIRVRFDGAVFLIDTGMLDSTFFPGGRGSALEIADGIVSAIYAGEPHQVIWQPAHEKAAAAAFRAIGGQASLSARSK